ncbi:MAG: hypothetical protein INF64_10865 [Roseomonas sp.]|nr:hypothetical protein [Roseomonas sp.]
MARKPAAPPPMPASFAWETGTWDAGAVRRALEAAKVKPPFGDLEGAAVHLEMLAQDFGAIAPPRAEAMARWAKETGEAARKLLAALGADPGEIARGGVVLPADAREALEGALEPGLMLAPPESPLAGLARDLGALAKHQRAKALAPAMQGLGLLLLALQEAEGFWGGYAKGAGKTPDHYGRVLALRCAAAYRHATGREPGAQANGPAVRFALGVFAMLAPRRPAPSAVAIAEHFRAGREGRKARPKRKAKTVGKLPR